MSEYKVMTFGLGGNHSECVKKSGQKYTSSWYIGPNELQRYIDDGTYQKEMVEGCILVDIIQPISENPSLVLSEPMCDPTLADDEENKFNQSILNDPVIKAITAEFSAGGGSLAVASGLFGGLDFVSVKKYVDWWKRRGARIGKVEDGKVVWFPVYGQSELF
jgi:hypothetical protein